MTYQVQNMPEGTIVRWCGQVGYLTHDAGCFLNTPDGKAIEIAPERWVELVAWPHEIAPRVAPRLANVPCERTAVVNYLLPFDTVVRRGNGQVVIVGTHCQELGDGIAWQSCGWTLEEYGVRFDIGEQVEVLALPVEAARLFLCHD